MDPGRAALALLLALAFGLAAQAIFFRELTGLNLALAVALFLGMAWRLRPPRQVRARDAWLPAAALLFATFAALRADAALVAFDTIAAWGLAVATVASLSGARLEQLPAARVVREVAALVGHLVARALWVFRWARPRINALPRGRVDRVAGPAAGIALALPLLLVFGALFSAADAVFSRTISDVLDVRRLRELLAEAPGRVWIAAVATWTTAGAVAALWRPVPEDAGPRRRPILRADTAIVALAAIDLLFALFVLLQLAYLFGGRSTIDAAGVTHSEYARRGFFELIAVATLAWTVLFALDRTLRRRDRGFVTAALGLLALTSVVLASAWYRLDLYQRAFGWTELRFYAYAAIAFLALGVGVLAWAVARDRVSYVLQPLMVAALVVAVAVNLIGPSATVANANLDRAVHPELIPLDAVDRLDTWYLVSLGHGAIPTLLARLEALQLDERAEVLLWIRSRVTYGSLARADSWPGWNLERWLAWRAIEGDPRVASGCEREPARDGPPVSWCDPRGKR